ncbi:MAG: hypothetical protein K1060chlam4_00095 [Candidatus Anoxychlamydiales bacterium]|nr:hypothetical protein [Candidatus Anoxychlamydiales bacterium]
MEFNEKYFMFFWKLPISLKCLEDDLLITSHVYASKKTQNVIQYLQSLNSVKQFPAILNAIYPQYGIPDLGCHHRILGANLDLTNFSEARKETWNILGLLRLVKPLPIQIAGTVQIHENDISCFETIWSKTYLNVSSIEKLEYVEEDLEGAKNLWNRLFKNSPKKTRILSGVRSFIKASLTEQIAHEDTFFKVLFPILDLLMGNPSYKHKDHLLKTISPWLQFVYKKEAEKNKIDFTKVLTNLWDNYRHHYLHHSESELPPSHLYKKINGEYKHEGQSQDKDSLKAVYALHEIVRLMLLSILFIDKIVQDQFNNLPLVEGHKIPNDKKESDLFRKEAFIIFFQSLIDNKTKPTKTFWIDSWHKDIFCHLS